MRYDPVMADKGARTIAANGVLTKPGVRFIPMCNTTAMKMMAPTHKSMRSTLSCDCSVLRKRLDRENSVCCDCSSVLVLSSVLLLVSRASSVPAERMHSNFRQAGGGGLADIIAGRQLALTHSNTIEPCTDTILLLTLADKLLFNNGRNL